MRKFLIVAVLAVALFAALAPPVFAQAPTPKVTITGLFDQITSGGENLYSGNYSRRGDHEWYARTRFRPDFVFEVGRTKAVMGLEIDLAYGQIFSAAGGPGKNATGQFLAPNQKFGVTSDLGINTDTAGVIEFKWIYTEFDLTGKDSLMPFIPVLTVARAGAQPFASIAQMREYAVFAGGDFAGLGLTTTWSPSVTSKVAWIILEDEVATSQQNNVVTTPTTPKLTRGKDNAWIVSPEINVFKGLDLKPLYAYLRTDGLTSGTVRRGAIDRHLGNDSGAGQAAVFGSAGQTTNSLAAWGGSSCTSAATCPNPATQGDPAQHENRHTFGIEARYRMGPFGLDPIFYYQVGDRHVQAAINHSGGPFTVGRVRTDQSSFLFDTVGSYQTGPFLLEVRGIYTPGNSARDNLAKRIKYFEPLSEDSSYFAGWAQILALGTDYFNGSNNNSMATNIGYDRYGRGQLGIRATYSVTPALNVQAMLDPTWTAKAVDTNTGNVGGLRTIVGPNSFVQGQSSYLGTEFDLGFNWTFAPNTTFSLFGGWLFAGHAYDTEECTGGGAVGTCAGGTLVTRRAHDAYTVASRLRFAF